MRFGVVFSIAIAVFLIAQNVFAQATIHGVMKVVKGDVRVKAAADGKEFKVKVGQKVFPGDTVIAGKDSRAKIIMIDNNEINVSPETEMKIQDYEYKPGEDKKNVILNVIYGKVRAKVNQKYDDDKNKFQVKTPSAVAGVRGTDFLTGYNRSTKETQVITFEGKVNFGQLVNGRITNNVFVSAGQMTSIVGTRPPAPPVEIPNADLANWDMDSGVDAVGSDDSRDPAADSGESENGEKKDGKKNDKNDKKESSRGPASVTPGPGGGESLQLLTGGDLPSDPVFRDPGPPPPPPPPPSLPGLRPCESCNQLIENRQRQLNIKVNLQGPGP